MACYIFLKQFFSSLQYFEMQFYWEANFNITLVLLDLVEREINRLIFDKILH